MGLYAFDGPTIFQPRFLTGKMESLYDVNNLEAKLQEIFSCSGQSLSFSDALGDVLIPAVSSEGTKWFQSRQCDKRVKMFDIVRASAAAPGYFPSHDIEGCHFVDGGMRVNNPAREAFNRARGIYSNEGQKPKFCLVSLGCGNFPNSIEVRRSALGWGAPLAAQAMFALCDNTIEVHRSMVTECNAYGAQYIRCDPDLPEPIDLGDASGESIAALLSVAELYLENAYASESNWWNKLIERFSG